MINRFISKFIKRNDLSLRYNKWAKENPGKLFKDFYAHEVLSHLESGRPHATLGSNLKKDEEFGVSGLRFFNEIVELGLNKNHTLIDYGCGTLRIGVHFIKFLEPRNYWGLDIDQKLLDYGKSLLNGDLLETKRPNLHVINEKSVQLAASSKPDFIVSVAVAIHVHPDELNEYMSNLAQIMSKYTRTVITIRFARKTIQYSGRSWAHGERNFYKLADKYGLTIEHMDTMSWEQTNPSAAGSRATLILSRK